MTHVPKVVGSNPGTVYWMDIFSHLFVVKICNVCLKRPKINENRPGLTHFLNSLLGKFRWTWSNRLEVIAINVFIPAPTLVAVMPWTQPQPTGGLRHYVLQLV